MLDRRAQGVVLVVLLAALCFGGWGLYEVGRSHGFREGRMSASGTVSAAPTTPPGSAERPRPEATVPAEAGESPSAPPAVESGLADEDATSSAGAVADVVHATRTGKKYHREGCRFLSKSDLPMTRSEAEAKGLAPCGVCQP